MVSLLDDPKYMYTKEEGRNFGITKAFAKHMAKKMVDVYRSRGVDIGLNMRQGDIARYVEKILQQRTELLSGINIAGMDVNQLIESGAHRNSHPVQNMLMSVLYDVISDKSK